LTSIKYHFILYIMKNIINTIEEKKKRLDIYRPLPKEQVANLEEWFKVELTYNSNAIEGNTLDRDETALVVEKGITIEGKTIREHLEAINHAEALDYLKDLVNEKREQLTERDILQIHWLVLKKIDDENAGKYRRVAVKISGNDLVLPDPIKVPELMTEFIKWLTGKNVDYPIKIVADAHFKLVTIHPFIDGNGRTARLLMDLLLMQYGYPPAIIKKEERRVYIESLNKGQTTGDLADFYNFIYTTVERSLDIYLDLLEPSEKVEKVEEKGVVAAKRLLKIGELAKESGEAISTIRFWAQEGLFDIADYTAGGYMLFDQSMIERAKMIRKLQEDERLTISEIKEKLTNGKNL